MDPRERRRSARINWKGEVRLITPNGQQVNASIADMSEDGWGVLLATPLERGLIVAIEGMGFEGSAIVRHCEPAGTGYRLGLELRPPAMIATAS